LTSRKRRPLLQNRPGQQQRPPLLLHTRPPLTQQLPRLVQQVGTKLLNVLGSCPLYLCGHAGCTQKSRHFDTTLTRFTHTHTHTHTCACTHTRTHRHTRHTQIHTHTYTHTHAHTHTHRYTHTDTHSYTHRYTHIWTHAHTCVYPTSHLTPPKKPQAHPRQLGGPHTCQTGLMC